MENEILISGVLGIVGSLAVAVGDMFLLGNPVSAKTFSARKLDNLLHVSPRNMWIGHTVGVLAIPLVMFGVYQIYLGLVPAGRLAALVPVGIMIFMMVVGAAAHACFAFLGGALQLQRRLGAEAGSPVDDLVKTHRKLLRTLFVGFLASLVAGSIAFAWVVLTGETLYPKWVAATNPLVLLIVLGLIEGVLPAPFGGYIRPANGNIAFAVFFAISTITLMD